METYSRLHAFIPPSYRSYKVIIRNLHHTTLISDNSDILSDLGHSTRRITNVIKNGNPCPLFLMKLKPNNNNKDIFNFSSILHTKIKIELPYRTISSPPQCIKCQNYGHTANYCHHLPCCVKCGGDHSTDSCTKDKDSSVKCALCMGDHTSNYRGCISFKALLKRSKSFHSKPQNPNSVLSSHQPKTPPPHLPKVSFTSVVDSNTIPLPNSHTSDI
jgi:PAX-interacting protein 1